MLLTRTRARALPALATVAALSLVAACGGSDGDEPGSAASPSASASEDASADASADASEGASADAGGELTIDDFGDRVTAAFTDAGTVTFELEQSGGGQEASGVGEADLSGDEISSKVDLDTAQGTVSVIVTGGTYYLKIPQLPTDGKWLRVDPDAESGLGALVGQLGGSADPRRSVEVLKQVSEVTAEGQEEVAGTETTKYAVVLPRDAVVESLGVDPQVASLLPEEIAYDVWVDADDRARRVVSTVEVQGQSSTTTVTYTSYGEPVDVAAPPAAQVTDQVPGLGG